MASSWLSSSSARGEQNTTRKIKALAIRQERPILDHAFRKEKTIPARESAIIRLDMDRKGSTICLNKLIRVWRNCQKEREIFLPDVATKVLCRSFPHVLADLRLLIKKDLGIWRRSCTETAGLTFRNRTSNTYENKPQKLQESQKCGRAHVVFGLYLLSLLCLEVQTPELVF